MGGEVNAMAYLQTRLERGQVTAALVEAAGGQSKLDVARPVIGRRLGTVGGVGENAEACCIASNLFQHMVYIHGCIGHLSIMLPLRSIRREGETYHSVCTAICFSPRVQHRSGHFPVGSHAGGCNERRVLSCSPGGQSVPYRERAAYLRTVPHEVPVRQA